VSDELTIASMLLVLSRKARGPVVEGTRLKAIPATLPDRYQDTSSRSRCKAFVAPRCDSVNVRTPRNTDLAHFKFHFSFSSPSSSRLTTHAVLRLFSPASERIIMRGEKTSAWLTARTTRERFRDHTHTQLVLRRCNGEACLEKSGSHVSCLFNDTPCPQLITAPQKHSISLLRSVRVP
jgi:hypothetical protein